MTTYGILWDLDGILIDTGEFHFQSWAETLAAHDIPYSRDLFRATFGMNNVGTLTHLVGQPPAAEFALLVDDQKETAFRAAIKGRAQPLPGVVQWLTYFKEHNIPQAIASSAPMANIDVLIDELGLRPMFSAVVSGSQMRGKPHPDVFLEAAKQLGLEPAQCAVVEDSVAGVMAAKRAGMGCVAVTNTNPAGVLKEAGADVIVASLIDLPPGAFEALVQNGGPL
jgi:HAD superfamily hydrolase (TIGR01509 family)